MHWLVFVAGTIVCWGLYVPTIHMGQVELGSAMRAFLCVGLAYFVMAIVIPGVVMATQPSEGAWSMRGTTIATIAGALGAAGALGIIFALRAGGTPLVVPPLVFGFAPLVNVAFGMIKNPPKEMPSPLLFVGFAMLALGAGMVLRFKP